MKFPSKILPSQNKICEIIAENRWTFQNHTKQGRGGGGRGGLFLKSKREAKEHSKTIQSNIDGMLLKKVEDSSLDFLTRPGL